MSDWSHQQAWCLACRPEICVFNHVSCADETDLCRPPFDWLLPTPPGSLYPRARYKQTCIYCNHDCSWLKHWVRCDHLSTEIFLIFSFHGPEPSLFCFALSFHFHVFSLDERMPSALSLPIMLRHIKDVGLVRHVSGFESHLSGFLCTKTIQKTHNIIEIHAHRRD